LPLAPVAAEQERYTLGFGRLFSNDQIGDGEDRWRSGSYTFSILRGYDWEGAPPQRLFDIFEYRLRTEIIAPQRLNGPLSTDRPYVGSLFFGLHTHFAQGETLISGGMDIIAVGPQTGVADWQDWFHDLVDAPTFSQGVKEAQVDNAIYAQATIEAARPVMLNETTQLRPFLEVQAGAETLIRAGADVIIGPHLQDVLWLRDSTTGQLYQGVGGNLSGFGFVLGADAAQIADSRYLPASYGVQAEETRMRARAGVHWQFGPDASFFYGLTYLSEEYEGQPEGQVLGSVKLNFNF